MHHDKQKADKARNLSQTVRLFDKLVIKEMYLSSLLYMNNS